MHVRLRRIWLSTEISPPFDPHTSSICIDVYYNGTRVHRLHLYACTKTNQKRLFPANPYVVGAKGVSRPTEEPLLKLKGHTHLRQHDKCPTGLKLFIYIYIYIYIYYIYMYICFKYSDPGPDLMEGFKGNCSGQQMLGGIRMPEHIKNIF
jgi:hypothetical protein